MVQLELAALDAAPQPRRQLEPRERVDRAVAVDVDAAAGRPCASYMAASACLRSASGVSASSGNMLMPTPASTSSSAAPSANGACMASAIRWPTASAASRPVRRQVADEHEELVAALAHDEVARAAPPCAGASATWHSSSSPRSWPSESLTRLNSLRSANASATEVPAARASTTALTSASSSAERLASPVRGSWYAR